MYCGKGLPYVGSFWMSDSLTSEYLLLLPGLMCDARLWLPQIKSLESHCEISVGDIGSADNVADIARSVLRAAPSRFAVAGLSMGGIIALEMWRQQPDRIQKLALLDSNFRADTPAKKHLRDQQMQRTLSGELEQILRDELKPSYLAQCHKENLQLLENVLKMGLELGADVFLRQSKALRDRPDSSATLPTICCPTLVLCGVEDQLCPVDLHREMSEKIAGAGLKTIPDCGHLATLEQPEAVTTALHEWLSAA